jgi:hypothetical protein
MVIRKCNGQWSIVNEEVTSSTLRHNIKDTQTPLRHYRHLPGRTLTIDHLCCLWFAPTLKYAPVLHATLTIDH